MAPDSAGILLPAAPGGQIAIGSQLGILGNRKAIDTPFNVTGYTAQFIADTQARSIADVTAADPSVRTIFPRAGYRDVYAIRGFNLFSYNTGFDGLYGIAPKQRYPAQFAERVEILKGPDTFLNGMSLGGAVGGAINIIPKRAGSGPVATLTTSYISNGDVGVHVDAGRRYGQDRQFGIRVNGLMDGGHQAIHDQSQHLGAAVLSLDYQGQRWRLYGDFGHQRQTIDAPDWAVTVARGVTTLPVPASTTSLSQSWAQMVSQDSYGVVRGEADLSDNWTAFGAYGVSRTRTTGVYVQPTDLTATGNYTGVIRAFPSSGTHYSGQLGVRGAFDTGPLTHSVTFALARWHQDLKATAVTLGNFTSSIYRPVVIARPDMSSVIDLDGIHRTAGHTFTSLVAADTVGLFEKRLLLTLGGRWQRIDSTSFAANTGAVTSSYDKSALSPALGVVWKVTDHVSVYGNYVGALQQGTAAPVTANNYGDTFAPAVSKQVEGGVKVDWSTWSSSVSVFQITQPSGFTDPVSNVYGMNGQQRNRGLEVNVSGEPVRGLRVLGGVMLLDARQTRTQRGTYDGKKAVGSPDIQVSLGLDWDTLFVRDLSLSARVIATGTQAVDVANTQKVAGWVRTDIGARYVVATSGKPVTLRFVIENVFDSSYWASAATGQIAGLSRGAPRTFMVSSTFQF